MSKTPKIKYRLGIFPDSTTIFFQILEMDERFRSTDKYYKVSLIP